MFSQKKLVKLGTEVVLVLLLIQGVFGLDSTVREMESLSQGEKVIFLYDVSDTEQVLVAMNTDGSGKVELEKGDITAFKVSPDERKVACGLRKDGLWIVNLDGSGRQQLSRENVCEIEWIKDSEIVYVSFDEKNTKINVYNLATNTNRVIFEGGVWKE